MRVWLWWWRIVPFLERNVRPNPFIYRTKCLTSNMERRQSLFVIYIVISNAFLCDIGFTVYFRPIYVTIPQVRLPNCLKVAYTIRLLPALCESYKKTLKQNLTKWVYSTISDICLYNFNRYAAEQWPAVRGPFPNTRSLWRGAKCYPSNPCYQLNPQTPPF